MKQHLHSLRQELSEAIQRSRDSHLKIAVTGLSRSGKTAFITSVINQILHLSQHTRPFLSVSQSQRVVGTKRLPQQNQMVRRFEYEQAMAALEHSPAAWPEPTRDVSETRLILKYHPQKRHKRLLGQTQTLSIDLVDYPGEWLLDLPMMEMDFETWSEMQLALLTGQRGTFAKDWLDAMASISLSEEGDELQLAAVAQTFTDYLHHTKAAGYHWIQPGRFILPGALAGLPALQFFPCTPMENPPANSAYQLLKSRYEAYQTDVVKRFYKEHFVTFDRQVVLVDCLTPLTQGHDAFVDMQRALQQLLHVFRYGRSGLLSRIFSPKIDKVLFAATKVDHITPDQHAHLAQLLNQMIYPMWQHIAYDHVTMNCMTLASIQATQAGLVETDSGRCHALKGVTRAGEQATLFPGEVPPRLPEADYWLAHGFDFIDFLPQTCPPHSPLPSIRVDQALNYLIGDKLT